MAPRGPVTPDGPASPLEPLSPWIPSGPWYPGGPRSPRSPGAPGGPRDPFSPMHVQPLLPGTQRRPQAPSGGSSPSPASSVTFADSSGSAGITLGSSFGQRSADLLGRLPSCEERATMSAICARTGECTRVNQLERQSRSFLQVSLCFFPFFLAFALSFSSLRSSLHHDARASPFLLISSTETRMHTRGCRSSSGYLAHHRLTHAISGFASCCLSFSARFC